MIVNNMIWSYELHTDVPLKAVEVANTSDIIVLAVGAGWNSDGENGDRGTLGLSSNQST